MHAVKPESVLGSHNKELVFCICELTGHKATLNFLGTFSVAREFGHHRAMLDLPGTKPKRRESKKILSFLFLCFCFWCCKIKGHHFNPLSDHWTFTADPSSAAPSAAAARHSITKHAVLT